MEFLDEIKQRIPDYAKDVRLNLDAVIARSSLPQTEALGAALAAAFAAKSDMLVSAIRSSGLLAEADVQAALTAASIMGMTNAWYSFIDLADDAQLKSLPAQLRMNGYQNHGGTTRRSFEVYALSASVVGKCRFCISSHVEVLRKEGVGDAELRDIGRIAAVINSAAQVLAAELGATVGTTV
ncbi:MAG: carboxymuconolactone decarboxylase family protein [Proteobacteria bacterium]|nr:carboxymuconolactone decarboxylase family protein [Burkholderiales bacterium]